MSAFASSISSRRSRSVELHAASNHIGDFSDPMNLLLALIPDQALILVIAAIALGLIVGIISRQRAMTLVGSIVLMLLLGPFIEALFAALPWWLILLAFVFFVLSLLRAFSNTLLGTHATDHMVGLLGADVVRYCLAGCFRLIALPFRIVGWIFRRGY